MITTQYSLNSLNQLPRDSIQKACDRLSIPLPEETLIQLPQIQETSKSVTSVSVLLFQKQNDNPSLLMVHQKWKKGNCDFPGGFRAGAKEDKWAKPAQDDVENEEFFPLLSGSRELAEEVPFLFQKQESNNKAKLTKEAYQFLNQKDTKTIKNSGWDQYPVLMYVRTLSDEHVQRVSKAINGEIDVKNEEVIAISLVAFSALKKAFMDVQWTKNGLADRAKLIEEAAAKKEQADLAQFARYTTPISLKNIHGGDIIISDYTARSIFNSLDQIEDILRK